VGVSFDGVLLTVMVLSSSGFFTSAMRFTSFLIDGNKNGLGPETKTLSGRLFPPFTSGQHDLKYSAVNAK